MSESIVELARIDVQAISIKVRPDPQALEKIDELMLQANADGTVQVDAFGTDPHGNAWHVSRALEEQAYENMRQRLLIKEQASLPPFSSFKSGNTLGRAVGEAAPAAVPAVQANPSIKAETEAEGVTGKQVLDGIQVGLDVIGLVPVFGEIADVANAGVSLVRGDFVGAGLSLASAIPFVGWFATAGKSGKRVSDLAGATKPAHQKSHDIPSKPKDSVEPQGRKGKDGGRVKGDGKDCRLRTYSEGCPTGRTPHHVVPDRVFRMPGERGTRLPNGIAHKDGLCICVDGASPRKKGPRPNEHGMVHALYDVEELAIGASGNPPGTAPLWKLEAAGVAAASAVTGCNPVIMAAQLRTHHQSKGLSALEIYRADPRGVYINKVDPASLGKSSMPTGNGGL